VDKIRRQILVSRVTGHVLFWTIHFSGKRVNQELGSWQPSTTLPSYVRLSVIGHQMLSFVAKASYYTDKSRSSDPTFLNVELRG
jgi:hypothetical protein